MNIRKLTKADILELDEPICGSSGCSYDANWEVVHKDLRSKETEAGNSSGDTGMSANTNLPNPDLVTFQAVRFYCDVHARTFCLESNVEVPATLRLN